MVSNYLRDCSKNIAGSDSKLFIGYYEDISGTTWSGNTLTDLTMKTGKYMGLIQADLDSVNYTSSGVAQRGYFSEQNLIANFSKKSPELEEMVESLLNGSVCGLFCLRLDGLNNMWVSGISPVEKLGGNRPFMSVQEEFDGGESIENSEEGNRYTLTLSRMSATREFPVDSVIKDSILDGTATFVDWPS